MKWLGTNDAMNELGVLQTKKGNKEIKGCGHADRNGFFYVLDRTNGQVYSRLPSSDTSPGPRGLDKNGRPIYSEDHRPGAP